MKAMIPFGTSSLLTTDVGRLFGDYFSALPVFANGRGVAVPTVRLDIAETDEVYRVHAELPGVSREDIELRVSGNVVTIVGEKKSSTDEPGHRERVFGRFERTFELPTPVESKNVIAELKDGVLTITLPKADSQKTARIEIKG